MSKSLDCAQDSAAVTALVIQTLGHARDEESVFLPLSQAILGRDSLHMAALGVSLHLRHAVPGLLKARGLRG